MYTDDYMRSRGLVRRAEGAGNGGGNCTCGDSCIPQSRWGIAGYPLAGVYAPLQDFTELYCLDAALAAGTLFKQLDLPFTGSACGSRGGGCRG